MFVLFLDIVPWPLIAHSAHFKVVLLCLPLFIFPFTLSNLLLTSFIADYFSFQKFTIFLFLRMASLCLLKHLEFVY